MLWRAVYDPILDGDYGSARVWIQCINGTGEYKVAIQQLREILYVPRADDSVDYEAMNVHELASYIEEFRVPSEGGGQLPHLWKYVREQLQRGHYTYAAQFVQQCLWERISPECRKALEVLQLKLTR